MITSWQLAGRTHLSRLPSNYFHVAGKRCPNGWRGTILCIHPVETLMCPDNVWYLCQVLDLALRGFLDSQWQLSVRWVQSSQNIDECSHHCFVQHVKIDANALQGTDNTEQSAPSSYRSPGDGGPFRDWPCHCTGVHARWESSWVLLWVSQVCSAYDSTSCNVLCTIHMHSGVLAVRTVRFQTEKSEILSYKIKWLDADVISSAAENASEMGCLQMLSLPQRIVQVVQGLYIQRPWTCSQS